MPTAIATPSMMNWNEVEAEHLQHLAELRQEQGGAGDRDHAADAAGSRWPPRTAAAIGREQIGVADLQRRVADEGREQDAGDAVEERGSHEGSASGRPQILMPATQAARGLAPTAAKRRPMTVLRRMVSDGQHAAATQTETLIPRKREPPQVGEHRRHPRLRRQRLAVPERRARRDRADGERDDQRVELEHGDQEAVDEADSVAKSSSAATIAEQDGARPLPPETPRSDGARERDDGRDRQIDAARHEHERLAHRGDAEKGRERDDRRGSSRAACCAARRSRRRPAGPTSASQIAAKAHLHAARAGDARLLTGMPRASGVCVGGDGRGR